MADTRALPLLSGIAPRMESAQTDPNCRRCNREFGLLTRRKMCNHCGFAYCGSCCDHQALCPRSDASYRPGYETVLVCTYCIDMLSITACGKSQLRAMPIARLRGYLQAYGIKPKSAIEKDDLIEAIIDARGLNGGISSENEQYYRRQTIAKRPPMNTGHRGLFSSNSGRTNAPAPPPRPRSTDPRVQTQTRPAPASPPPPLRPPVPPTWTSDPYQQNSYAQQSHHTQRPMSPRRESNRTPANNTRSPPRSPPPRSPPLHGVHMNMNGPPGQPPPQPRWQTRPQSPPPQAQASPDYLRPGTPGRTRSRSVNAADAPPQARQQPPPPPPPLSPRPRAAAPTAVPLLSALLDKSRDDISAFSISILKGILQANHVNARMILEKSELVDKVMSLVETERRERAREQAIHEAEERAAIEQQRQRMEQLRVDAERRAQASASGPHQNRAKSPPPTRPTSPRPAPMPSAGAFVEREGLCVVCQDEEANVAIVDCGHLALCMACSDIIMKSTRECPLCRTRIVTEQRLLRIFKT